MNKRHKTNVNSNVRLLDIPLQILAKYKGKQNLQTKVEDIISSERLFRPIAISGLSISKKRWRKIGEQANYDKFRDSNYSEITLVAGATDYLQLWKGGAGVGFISEKEAEKHERWTIWGATDLEKRILKSLI